MSERSIGGWLQAVYPGMEVEPQIVKLNEEIAEAEHARTNGNTDLETMREYVDIAYVAMTIVTIYGGDPIAEVQRVADKNYVKYPPEVVANIEGLGYSKQEALQFCKDQWMGDEAYDNGDPHAIQYPLPNV